MLGQNLSSSDSVEEFQCKSSKQFAVSVATHPCSVSWCRIVIFLFKASPSVRDHSESVLHSAEGWMRDLETELRMFHEFECYFRWMKNALRMLLTEGNKKYYSASTHRAWVGTTFTENCFFQSSFDLHWSSSTLSEATWERGSLSRTSIGMRLSMGMRLHTSQKGIWEVLQVCREAQNCTLLA